MTNHLRHQPMVWLCAASAVGIAADRWASFSAGWWVAGAAVCLAAWSFWLRRRGGIVGALFILCGVMCVAALWHRDRWHYFASDDLGFCATETPQPACVELQACSTPRWEPAPPPDPLATMPGTDESYVMARVRRVRDGAEWRLASGNVVLVVNGRLPPIRAGDRLRVLASLSKPRRPLNPGEHDPAEYDRSCRRLCRLHASSRDDIAVLERGSAWWPTTLLSRIRERCDIYLWRHIRHSRAGLASAVLLGFREEIGQERQQDYMLTGTIHLLSISGLHLAILAYGFWVTARLGFLSRRVSLCVAIVFAATYAAFTDAQPPVVRAAVLVVVMCVARWLVRQPLNFNTLAVAGIIVLALNPASLFQTGAQLSFLAVATMAVMPWFTGADIKCDDPLQRLIADSRSSFEKAVRAVVRSTWQALVLSTVIWLVAVPLVAYRFHIVTPIATILNPIVCLPMSVALFAGFGVMVFGFLLPPLASVCGWVCDVSLWMMEWSIAQAMRMPGNHFWVATPPAWWVLAFYVVLACWLAVPVTRPPPRWVWALICVWLAWGGWFATTPAGLASDRGQLTCTFVAVGHGTSAVIELPDGKTILYDAGRLGSPAMGSRAISNVLWSRGIVHLDAVIISHADADHFNALPELLERFSVGVIYVSPTMFQSRQEAVSALCVAIARHDIEIRALSAGDRLLCDEVCEMRILHPPPRGIHGSDNANSIVLFVEYRGRTILLPGDLESPGTELLLAQSPVDCDVVMAPHHGSLRSNPFGFVQWSTPEFVIISGAQGRAATAVRQAYSANRASVLHTAYDGAVEVAITWDKLRVRPFIARR